MQTVEVKAIRPEEMLYRVIKRTQPKWVQQLRDDEDVYHPTPAMYKDKGGISVDRDDGRKEPVVIQSIMNGQLSQRTKGIAKVSAADCSDIGVKALHAPTPENYYHSNIFLDPDDDDMQELQSLQLADASVVVYFNASMPWINSKTGRPYT